MPLDIPNIFKENRLQENLLRLKMRKKIKETPTKILKILVDECNRVLEKRSKNGK